MRQFFICSLLAVFVVVNPTQAQKDYSKLHRTLKGTWKTKLDNGVKTIDTSLEFDDGDVTFKISKAVIKGTYKFIDEKTIEITFRINADSRTRQSKFKIEMDQLTLTDSKGKTEIFRRVK